MISTTDLMIDLLIAILILGAWCLGLRHGYRLRGERHWRTFHRLIEATREPAPPPDVAAKLVEAVVNVQRLERLSHRDLVMEVAHEPIADRQDVTEMMSRLYPQWVTEYCDCSRCQPAQLARYLVPGG